MCRVAAARARTIRNKDKANPIRARMSVVLTSLSTPCLLPRRTSGAAYAGVLRSSEEGAEA